MSVLIIISSIIGGIILGGIFFWFLGKKGKIDQTQNDNIRDLERRLTDLMINQLKEVRDSQSGTSQLMHDQIHSFTKEATQIKEEVKQMQEAVKGVSSFQEIFRTPKLRGNYGELALKYILSQYFPKDMFKLQHYFKNGKAVDAVLKLPDGKLLPIDSKLSFTHFERMIHAKNDIDKEAAKKSFSNELKKEIDDIAEKYIIPSEGTTDIAFMYILAEAAYSEINNSLPEVIDYARPKKVFLASPNTFYLMIQFIQHWARDLQVGRQTQNFIKKMERIITDAQKLNESFDKLGRHLNDARSSYEDSNKRLELLTERTEKLVELEDKGKLLDSPEK